MTLNDFATLQNLADALVAPKHPLTAPARAALRQLGATGGPEGEGHLVEVVGYLVGSAKKEGRESVNCHLLAEAENDFHIPLARAPQRSEFQGIVVEMIPQGRPAEWTLDKLLKAVAQAQQPVRVRGQLLYDTMHLVNNNPHQPIKGQPKRFSLWEIHPVTAVDVCATATKLCDRLKDEEWRPLVEWQPA